MAVVQCCLYWPFSYISPKKVNSNIKMKAGLLT